MRLNKTKCKVLHMGWVNPGDPYRLRDEQIESSPAEKDMGVLVNERLDMSHQYVLAVQRKNHILVFIKRSLANRMRMVISQTGAEKAEVFNAFFSSVFNMDEGPRRPQCPELEDHDCENYQLPVNPEIVQDLLLQLDPYKCMGPDEIHPRILKELAHVIAKSLSMIFEHSC
ncbi:hypothetical protein WISP_136303 [Willisornis vidua]|uniref:Uncharacterized protein n=1 Tax=Willisornis vidua TaxID=1566151 RepID=A0ABQ9CTP4_9PASS|nr:hypothetical protein WISP_136303 [Willisornis vidua]